MPNLNISAASDSRAFASRGRSYMMTSAAGEDYCWWRLSDCGCMMVVCMRVYACVRVRVCAIHMHICRSYVPLPVILEVFVAQRS